MDRFGEWRPIAPAATADADEQSPTLMPARAADSVEGPASSVRIFGLLGAGVLGIAGAAIWLTNPGSGADSRLDVAGAAGFFSAATPEAAGFGDSRYTAAPAALIIDVQGAVVRPGVQRLAAGSRVGDAIEAAGGYSGQVDLAAASTSLNLAAPLTDGAKVHVPARGEVPASGPSGPGGSSGGDGAGPLINLNTATAEELDTLPGIGPVTAAKIMAAREQAPFATFDELVSRDVLGTATLEKIRPLATLAP